MPKVSHAAHSQSPPGDLGSRSHTATSRNNVPKACNGCRKRKTRCDGFPASTESPTTKNCSACATRGETCDWDPTVDKRLTVTKQAYEQQKIVIKTLRRENQVYRERLRQAGLDDSAPPDLPVDSDDDEGHGNQSDAEDEFSAALSGLVLEDNKVVYYGESSPFSSLPAPPETRTRMHNSVYGAQHSMSTNPGDMTPVHVLQTDPTSPPPPSCWDAFLCRGESNQPLISRAEHDRVLDYFFRFFAAWTLRIVPSLFLRDLAAATGTAILRPQTNHFSAMLHNAMVAVALSFSDRKELRDRAFRNRFIQKAKTYLDSECQRPALSTIQGLALISSYFSGISEQSLGFMYFGMSIRMGQALGLHVRIPDGHIANDDRIERNWVFWSVFVHDKTWALYVGREQGLPVGQVTIRDPMVDYRMDYEKWEWQAESGQLISQPARLSSTFSEVTKLMRFASRIMTAVYDHQLASRLGWKLDHISGIYQELRTWREKLDPELEVTDPHSSLRPPHIFMLNLAYEWMILLLLRPFYQHEMTPIAGEVKTPNRLTPGDARITSLVRLAAAECPTSATRVVDLLTSYDKLYTLRLSPLTNVQIAYLAGMTHLSTVVSGARGGKRAKEKGISSRERVQDCARLLRAIGETWGAGGTTADLLEKELAREIGKLEATQSTSVSSPFRTEDPESIRGTPLEAHWHETQSPVPSVPESGFYTHLPLQPSASPISVPSPGSFSSSSNPQVDQKNSSSPRQVIYGSIQPGAPFPYNQPYANSTISSFTDPNNLTYAYPPTETYAAGQPYSVNHQQPIDNRAVFNYQSLTFTSAQNDYRYSSSYLPNSSPSMDSWSPSGEPLPVAPSPSTPVFLFTPQNQEENYARPSAQSEHPHRHIQFQ